MTESELCTGRIFYWVDHTGTHEGNSDVQHVTRMLARGLLKRANDLVYVGWSQKDFSLIRADDAALRTLALHDGPVAISQEKAGIPIHLNGVDEESLRGSWLLVTEVTHHSVYQTRDLIDYCRVHDMKVAFLFYDLNPILSAGYHDVKGQHEAYVQQLTRADLVIPISEPSANSLRQYYLEAQRLSPSEIPEIVSALLGEAFIEADRPVLPEPSAKRVNARSLHLKTWTDYAEEIECRLKNHIALRRVYLWCDLIVSQPFNTGVQRVVRSMAKAVEDLGVELVCVRWDRTTNTLRCLNDEELAHMAKWNGPSRKLRVDLPEKFTGEWIILPEVMVPLVPEDGSLVPKLRERGLKVCSIFYDLIPHKMKENYPQAAIDYFTRYWLAIAESDIILGISHAVSGELYEFYQPRVAKLNNLKWRIRPAPLAGEFPEKPRSIVGPVIKEGTLNLLNVGTIEPRKNQFMLIDAIAEARSRTLIDIRVTFVGRGGAFPELDAKMQRLASEHEWITRLEHVTDDVLEQLYFNADLTAFASYEEGFGLPVLESLWACRPCICHNAGAIAEIAAGGGCLMVDMLDKEAITSGLVRLATEADLVAQLASEARGRPIRTWKEYALDVLTQMSGVAPRSEVTLRKQTGFRQSPLATLDRPLLSIAVTTYNRAEWLKHSLAGILDLTRAYRDVIEVLVCDNASTDNTAEVVEEMRRREAFGYHRNPVNVGMLGNLGVTAKHAQGEYVWVVGDDDLLVPGVIENILEGILDHPESEMVYLNYAYTNFDKPADLSDIGDVVSGAKPIAEGGPNRFVTQLREVAALNENFFTAIYACVFRRAHALMAYGQNVAGAPFASLRTCVPSTLYCMKRMLDLPAYWVGEPGVVVNMNVSWRKWALLWHLERMPELYDWVERERMGAGLVDRYRWNHSSAAADHVKGLYFHTEDGMRDTFNIETFIAQNIHLQSFRADVLPGVLKAYAEAYTHQRTPPNAPEPSLVAARFGVADLL